MKRASLYIPKRIKVGFQKRLGTYTGKLAYVIYYDERGALRKEASWDKWRDSDIEPVEYENTPTSGFVLNQKVGGNYTGWNHRNTYCRIYDPRGFEFEITIENLLFILENASSIKGKGLDGEFVYSWSGKDLVLLPVSAPDYKEAKNRTALIDENKTIKTQDLIVGATYSNSQYDEMIYMGRYDKFYCRFTSPFTFPSENKKLGIEIQNTGKFYWFYVPSAWNGNYFLHFCKAVPSKLFCVEESNHPKFGELFAKMQSSTTYSPPIPEKTEFIKSDDVDETLVRKGEYYKNWFVRQDGTLSETQSDLDANLVRIHLANGNTIDITGSFYSCSMR